MNKQIVLLAIALTLTSCGGGGGGNAWDGPLNAAGYPDVAGVYSASLPAVELNCSDGSSLSVPASSTDATVSETGNQLSVNDTFGYTNNPGVQVISDSGVNGTINTDGSFSLTRVRQVSEAGFGLITYNITYNGQFTTTGWDADIQLEATASSVDCSLTGNYSGTKIS